MNINKFANLYNYDDESSDESTSSSDTNILKEEITDNTIEHDNIEEDNVDNTKNTIETNINNEQNNKLDDDNWTVVNNQKKIKKKKKKYIKKEVNLWYKEDSWQNKLINNLYKFKQDDSSVLEKYDLLYLNKNYSKARNNYYRNRCILKMTQIINDKEWDNIKDLLYIPKN